MLQLLTYSVSPRLSVSECRVALAKMVVVPLLRAFHIDGCRTDNDDIPLQSNLTMFGGTARCDRDRELDHGFSKRTNSSTVMLSYTGTIFTLSVATRLIGECFKQVK